MIAINKDDILPNDEYKIVRNDRRGQVKEN